MTRHLFYATHIHKHTPFTPETCYSRHVLHQHLLHNACVVSSCNCISLRLLLHKKPSTPDTFYTKHLLHQTPFTPYASYAKATFAQDTLFHQTGNFHTRQLVRHIFFTRHFSRQTTFTPNTFYVLHPTPFTPTHFYQKLLTPAAFYSKQFLHQKPFIPDTFYTRHPSH